MGSSDKITNLEFRVIFFQLLNWDKKNFLANKKFILFFNCSKLRNIVKKNRRFGILDSWLYLMSSLFMKAVTDFRKKIPKQKFPSFTIDMCFCISSCQWLSFSKFAIISYSLGKFTAKCLKSLIFLTACFS